MRKKKLNWNDSNKIINKFGWTNIYPAFRRRARVDYDVEKLKGKFLAIKGQYYRWLKLHNQSGLGHDKNTGGVTADDSFWEERGQVHASS
jgi:hypothetical protein